MSNILICLLLFPVVGYSQYVSQSDILDSSNGYTSYTKFEKCIKKTGGPCFNMRNKNVETHTVVNGVAKEDSVLKAAHDAKVLARQNKKDKRAAALIDLRDNWEALSVVQKLDALREVVK